MQALPPSLEEEWSQLSLERGMQDIFPRTEEKYGLVTLLSKRFSGETLYLYLAVSESAVSGALVREDEGVQKPMYYVSHSMNGP